VELNLSDATYERFLKEGFVHTRRVAVRAEPRFAKVIVYDCSSDRVGSTTVAVK